MNVANSPVTGKITTPGVLLLVLKLVRLMWEWPFSTCSSIMVHCEQTPQRKTRPYQIFVSKAKRIRQKKRRKKRLIRQIICFVCFPFSKLRFCWITKEKGKNKTLFPNWIAVKEWKNTLCCFCFLIFLLYFFKQCLNRCRPASWKRYC